jgi:hypothetical protein
VCVSIDKYIYVYYARVHTHAPASVHTYIDVTVRKPYIHTPHPYQYACVTSIYLMITVFWQYIYVCQNERSYPFHLTLLPSSSSSSSSSSPPLPLSQYRLFRQKIHIWSVDKGEGGGGHHQLVCHHHQFLISIISSTTAVLNRNSLALSPPQHPRTLSPPPTFCLYFRSLQIVDEKPLTNRWNEGVAGGEEVLVDAPITMHMNVCIMMWQCSSSTLYIYIYIYIYIHIYMYIYL